MQPTNNWEFTRKLKIEELPVISSTPSAARYTDRMAGKRKADEFTWGQEVELIAGPFREVPLPEHSMHNVVIPYAVSFDQHFLGQPGNLKPSAWRRVVRFRAFPAVEVVVSPTETDFMNNPQLKFSIVGLHNVSALVAYELNSNFNTTVAGNTMSVRFNLGRMEIVWRGQLRTEDWEDPAPKQLISLLKNEASLKRADVTLLTRDGPQKAHSDVLVLESAFFKAKIERWSDGENKIDMDLSGDACALLLECIYGGFHECFVKGGGSSLDWASPAVKDLATFADYSNDTELMNSLLRAVPMITLASAMSVLEWGLPNKVDAFKGLLEKARTMVKHAAQESMDDPEMDDDELLSISKEIFEAKRRRLSTG